MRKFSLFLLSMFLFGASANAANNSFEIGFYNNKKTIRQITKAVANADRLFWYTGSDRFREVACTKGAFLHPIAGPKADSRTSFLSSEQIKRFFKSSNEQKKLLVVVTKLSTDSFKQNQGVLLEFFKELGFERVLVLGGNSWNSDTEVVMDEVFPHH